MARSLLLLALVLGMLIGLARIDLQTPREKFCMDTMDPGECISE